MPTKKKRINVSLNKDAVIFLKKLALRDEVPEATKASQLIEQAMMIEEDEFWAKKADAVMNSTKKFISHEEFWKGLI